MIPATVRCAALALISLLMTGGDDRIAASSGDGFVAGPAAGLSRLERTSSMRAGRAAHTATALRDGRVLVAGGFVEKGSPTGAELYDASAGRFVSALPMVETRHSHTATLLSDGRVLIAGG